MAPSKRVLVCVFCGLACLVLARGDEDFYSLEAEDINKQNVSFASFRGKVIYGNLGCVVNCQYSSISMINRYAWW